MKTVMFVYPSLNSASSTRTIDYYEQSVRQHKKLSDWARQMIYQLRRLVA